MSNKFVLGAVAALALGSMSPVPLITAASASSLSFSLDSGSSPPSNHAGSYGSVLVSQYSATQIEVQVNLNAGFDFHETTTTQHPMIGFNWQQTSLTGITANSSTFAINKITVLTSPSSNGLALIAPANPAGVGHFDYAITCTTPACGHGYPGGYDSPFTFVITSAGSLDPTMMEIKNNLNFYMMTDLVDSEGRTGNVASRSVKSVCHDNDGHECECGSGGTVPAGRITTPEPATFGLFGLGLGITALFKRRKKVA